MAVQIQAWDLLLNMQNFLNLAYRTTGKPWLTSRFDDEAPNFRQQAINSLEEHARATKLGYSILDKVRQELMESQGENKPALLPSIYESVQRVLKSMRVIRTQAAEVIRLPSQRSQSTQQNISDKSSGTTFQLTVAACIGSGSSSAIDLNASRTAMIALHTVVRSMRDLEREMESLFQPSNDPNQLSILQIREKAQEVTNHWLKRVFADIWGKSTAIYVVKIAYGNTMSDKMAATQLFNVQRLHTSYMQTIKCMKYLVAGIDIIAKEIGTLRGSLKFVQHCASGLQASLMTGDVWPLKISWQEWESSLTNFDRMFAVAMKPNLNHVLTAESSTERAAVVAKTNGNGGQIFNDTSRLGRDFVTIAAGISLIAFDITKKVDIGPLDIRLQSHRDSDSYWCTGTAGETPLRTWAITTLSIPASQATAVRQGTIDSLRFNKEKSPHNFWELRFEEIKYFSRVNFTKPFEGSAPKVSCWITECRQGMEPSEYGGKYNLFLVDAERIDRSGFDIKVTSTSPLGKDFQPGSDSRDQSFTISWIAIDTTQFPRPVYMTRVRDPRNAQGGRYRCDSVVFPIGHFSEPPVVFSALAGYEFLRGRSSWLQCHSERHHVSAAGCVIDYNTSILPSEYSDEDFDIGLTSVVIAVGKEYASL